MKTNQNSENNNDLFFCTNIRKLGWLKGHGFTPLRDAPNRNNPDRIVWVFERSKELLECLSDYYAKKYTKQEG